MACDFKLREEDVKPYIRGNFTGYSCERDVWENGKCIWHAKTSGKPIERLKQDLNNSDEPPIGVVLWDINASNRLPLAGCDLLKADIRRCNFSGADLEGVKITGATISNSNMTNSNLRYANLQNSKLETVNFSGADLYKAVFQGAEISKVDFRGAKLNKIRLNSVDLSGMNLSGMEFHNAHFEGTDLSNCKLTGADFSGAVFTGTTLTNVDFGGSDLSDVDFTGAEIDNTHFGGTNLSGAEFYNVDLRTAGLGGTVLEDTKFTKSNLSGLDLSDLNLSGCDLQDAELSGTNLRNADLSKSKLEGAIFQSVDLRGTDLSDAQSYQVYMQSVRLDSDSNFGNKCCYHKSDGKDIEAAIRVYRDYQQVLRENSLPEQVRKFKILEKNAKKEKAYKESKSEWLKAGISNVIWMYGESWKRVLLTSTAIMAIYSVLFFFTGINQSSTIPRSYSLLGFDIIVPDMVFNLVLSSYFSIVTFTTLGYGDVKPNSIISMVLAGTEALFGGLLIAALVFVLGRRATW